MFERFTDRARRMLALAEEECRRLEHVAIGPEHLLLALTREDDTLAAIALEGMGVSLAEVRHRVKEAAHPPGPGWVVGLPFTAEATRALDLSLREALQFNQVDVGPEHILLGVIAGGDPVAAQSLLALGADLVTARHEVKRVIELSGTKIGPVIVAPVIGIVDPGPPGLPPCCPYCHNSLVGKTQIHRLSVPDVPGGPGLVFDAVYCGSCGRSLAYPPRD